MSQQGDGVEARPCTQAQQHTIHRAAVREAALDVLRACAGTWLSVAELRALVQSRVPVSLELMRMTLTALVHEGLLDVQTWEMAERRVFRRWWRLRREEADDAG